jgi:hypothetical protein
MEKLKLAEGLGESIIKDQHDFFTTTKSEDLEHITNIKRIIGSISEYLRPEDLPEDGINSLAEYLKQLARSLYIEACISNKYEGDDDKAVREESEAWFDYIYENEKYPE